MVCPVMLLVWHRFGTGLAQGDDLIGHVAAGACQRLANALAQAAIAARHERYLASQVHFDLLHRYFVNCTCAAARLFLLRQRAHDRAPCGFCFGSNLGEYRIELFHLGLAKPCLQFFSLVGQA